MKDKLLLAYFLLILSCSLVRSRPYSNEAKCLWVYKDQVFDFTALETKPELNMKDKTHSFDIGTIKYNFCAPTLQKCNGQAANAIIEDSAGCQVLSPNNSYFTFELVNNKQR